MKLVVDRHNFVVTDAFQDARLEQHQRIFIKNTLLEIE